MKYYFVFIIYSFFCVFAGNASAGTLKNRFEEANQLFGQGEYEKALASYKELENYGVNSWVLFYNRATAEARIGNLGKAVLYYEKVSSIKPNHENSLNNLQLIRDYLIRQAHSQGRETELALPADPWEVVLNRFSPNMAATSFLVFYLLFFGIVLARRFVKRDIFQHVLGVTGGVFLVLVFLFGSLTLGKMYQDKNHQDAIVVVVKDGVLEVMETAHGTSARFELVEGSKVRIIERRGDWLRIKDPRGRDGWVLANSIGII